MCLLGFNQDNCKVRYIRGPMGATGPMGPRGPIGPQGATGPVGPQGLPATFDAVYAINGGGTVATGTVIPLTLSASTPQSTLTVTNNSVTVPAGTYIVSYFADGSVTTGNFDTSLYLNGAAVPNEVISQTNTAGSNSAAGKTALITVTTPSTISLYNTSADTATLSNASLFVQKIA